MNEKNPDLEEKEEIARIVGVGAIIFNDLFNQRIKDVAFNWDKILNFDGETGPYVQYTYARCASVLRKANMEVTNDIDYSLIQDEQSMNLLKEISRFGDVVKDVKINVDRTNNPYERYIAGDHMDSEDLTLRRWGHFATDDVGPAFIRIFKPGQVLYGSRRTYLKKVAVAHFEGITANTTFVLETKDDNIFAQRLLPFLMLSYIRR